MIAKTIALNAAASLVLIVYTCALLFIFLYSLVQARLVYSYLKYRKNKHENNSDKEMNFPFVTVQLPVYNELYVVERLLDSVSSFNYPREKMEIQVLDDSDDGTMCIIANKVSEWRRKDVNILHIRRSNRAGYKAGALKYGLESAKGEFIAIFDADFIPSKDFLLNTVGHFSEPDVGMVQTRWEHINGNYSLLTRLQAFGLNAHFSVEQAGRNNDGCFINFNGTAGVWRKECIIDAGNWKADTLTEDLDLSYRAQLKNWKFVYLEDVATPAELPPVISAIKSQQYRWTKGGAEVAVKYIGQILHSDKSFKVKWHALFHLLNSGVFVSVMLSAILSVPLLFIKHYFPGFRELFLIASFFLLSFAVLAVHYWVSVSKKNHSYLRVIWYFLSTFPMFLSMSMGLSFHNSIAVIEGYLGKKTPFIRTPKFNIKNQSDKWQNNRYILPGINLISISEGLLSIYFLFAVIEAFRMHDYGLLPFHLMLASGFFAVFYYSIFQSKFSPK